MSPLVRILVLALALLAPCGTAAAQGVYGPPTPGPSPQPAPAGGLFGTLSSEPLTGSTDGLNPIQVLDGAARALPGSEGAGLSAALNVMLLLTVISLVPSIMLMTTCFVRIMIVLALLRQAMGTQSLPPSQVVIGLSLFMTFLVMTPTIDRIYSEAVGPYQRGEVRDYEDLWDRARAPMRDFMFDQIEATGNWESLYMILEYRGVDISEENLRKMTREDVDMVTLIPAYMLSELKTAFLMGVRVYLPFLVIDMVIASLLISMSMMMLPPIMISMPFKLLLFVLVDGWQLVVGSLLHSFDTGAAADAAVSAIDAAGAVTAAGGVAPLMELIAAAPPPWAAAALT